MEIIGGFHAAYPEFDPAVVLTPDALARASIVDQNPPGALAAGLDNCSNNVDEAFSSSDKLVLAHNPVDLPGMVPLLRENSPGNRPAGAPVLEQRSSR